MRRRIFVDADVILDLLLAREPFFGAATHLFLLLQDGRVEGFTSPVVFANLFYMLRQGMPVSEAFAALRKLRLLLGVLAVNEKVVDRALASSLGDFEDAMQYCTAVAHKLDAVVTRNKRGYRDPELPILDAAECVQWVES
jgi:predicted nucleic acid-binding protein